MPSRKRKSLTKPATSPNKRARIAQDPEPTQPSRPKRKSVGKPQYNFTRPRKQANGNQKVESIAAEPETSAPKRRGRPPKDKTATAVEPNSIKNAVPGRSRGRPRSKTISQDLLAERVATKAVKATSTGQKRGRPRKTSSPSDKDKVFSNKSVIKAPRTKATKATKASKPQAPAEGTNVPRRRGRPPNSKETIVSLSNVLSDTDSGTDTNGAGATDEEHGDRQYWLMKAEPNDRYENGVNVKFSIDDLAATEVPEPWDGVRNFGARNNMRAMRKGDLAFFYHSNCQVPGIVGVMRVVQEHSPDQSAFDPKHPYYDPKSSPSNPKWDCVHVEFVKKFDMQVTLKMMQENKSSSGELSNMQLLKMGRLSVSAVSPREWRFILGMANEDVNIGETDTAAVHAEGYESDTDGEVEAGPQEELNGDIAAATTVVADVTHAPEEQMANNDRDNSN